MYIITSAKKDIRATSGTNNDVEFHNKLFKTDDCVITWQDDPTEEELIVIKADQEKAKAEASVRQKEAEEKEVLIQAKLREIAEAELIIDGKLNIEGKVVAVKVPTEEVIGE